VTVEGRWYQGGLARLRRLGDGPLVWHTAKSRWAWSATIDGKVVGVVRRRIVGAYFVNIDGWEFWAAPNAIRRRWMYVKPAAYMTATQAKSVVEHVIAQTRRTHDVVIGPDGYINFRESAQAA
jgi:hypothetical protein